MINEEEIERLRSRKYSVDYDAEFVKANIETAPCNIWGYIKNLEERITQLELKK